MDYSLHCIRIEPVRIDIILVFINELLKYMVRHCLLYTLTLYTEI